MNKNGEMSLQNQNVSSQLLLVNVLNCTVDVRVSKHSWKTVPKTNLTFTLPLAFTGKRVLPGEAGN